MSEMKFELDHINKKAYITGITADTVGAPTKGEYNSLLARLEALENKVVPTIYDLIINSNNGLTTVVSINSSQIGNSGANGLDLSAEFRLSSLAQGKETAWSTLTANDSSLEQRWNEGSVSTSPRGIIEKGGLTHIVLHELSNRPLINPDLFKQYCELFIDLIKQYNPSCLIYLAENWSYSDSINWQSDQSTINAVYKDICTRKGSILIPLGTAWNILRMQPGFTALNPYNDNKNPNNSGIYLNTMVCLGKILNINPLNNNYVPSGVSSTNALILRDIANKSLTQNVLNDFNEYQFNGIAVKEGSLIRNINYRASQIEIYVRNISWNNGTSQITNYGNQYKNVNLSYPTINEYAILIYQTGGTVVEISGTQSSPQLITGLDTTKPIYVAVNVYNYYASNTGGFIVGYR